MKKISKIAMLLLACMLIVGVTNVEAQYGKKKKKKKKKPKTEEVESDDDYFDERGGSFKDKLWYGGGVTLGYGGNNDRSQFTAGLSPMVGYKVTENLSFGPRLVIDYNALRDRNRFGVVNKGRSTNYGAGIFGRMKVLEFLFIHVEYSALNQAFYLVDQSGDLVVEPGTTDLATTREVTNNFYIGGGYFSGSGPGFGYEFVVLYNLLAPDDVVQQPLDFRAGFTFNF